MLHTGCLKGKADLRKGFKLTFWLFIFIISQSQPHTRGGHPGWEPSCAFRACPHGPGLGHCLSPCPRSRAPTPILTAPAGERKSYRPISWLKSREGKAWKGPDAIQAVSLPWSTKAEAISSQQGTETWPLLRQAAPARADTQPSSPAAARPGVQTQPGWHRDERAPSDMRTPLRTPASSPAYTIAALS